MLLLFWKNFTTIGDRQEAVYYSVEDGGRSVHYSGEQTKDPRVSYTVQARPAGTEYRHKDGESS